MEDVVDSTVALVACVASRTRCACVPRKKTARERGQDVITVVETGRSAALTVVGTATIATYTELRV